jgi:hypothetical protein
MTNLQNNTHRLGGKMKLQITEHDINTFDADTIIENYNCRSDGEWDDNQALDVWSLFTLVNEDEEAVCQVMIAPGVPHDEVGDIFFKKFPEADDFDGCITQHSNNAPLFSVEVA